jgi:hypothetical protein
MNPPTPTITQFQDENVYTPASHGALNSDREALSLTDGNAQRGSRPSSFVGSGGKSRFYGNLRASIRTFSGDHGKNADSNVIEIVPYHNGDSDGYDRTRTMQSESDYSGNIEVYASDSEDEELSQLNVQHLRMQNNNNIYSPSHREGINVSVHQASPVAGNDTGNWNDVRQVSNSTGYDLHSGYAGLGAEFGKGMARRREVSGKVVEEGRSMGFEEEEPEITPQKNKAGLGSSAAGWARFKGL